MTGRRVDLVLSEMHARDATSTHARLIRDLLVADGHLVGFVVERTTAIDEDVMLLTRWRADADLTILQHSIGSLAASEIARRRVPVVLNYHNVTPPEFVEAWEPDQIQGLRWGREQLWELRSVTHHAIADSEYNAKDLREVGIGPVDVVPVLFDALAGGADGVEDSGPVVGFANGVVGSGARSPGGEGAPSPASEASTILFVGRLSPNKCQQDLVAMLAVLNRLLVAEGRLPARLVLVGGGSSVGFVAAVEALAVELGVAESVVFAGSVSEAELVGWYRAADVFVCVSEHEGFCVPVVEAMGFGVPVVAFGAAAVPETLAGAGVVLGEKSPVSVASAVLRVLSDVGVREGLVARGRVRAAELGLAASSARMREVLVPLLDKPTP
jgi:glycosyltransferase involved in cell wall biosynthesis